MPWTDDRIASSMADIDPGGTGAPSEPTSAEWTRLRGIMAEQNHPRARRRSVLPRWAGATALIALLLVVPFAVGPWGAATAYASTPPALVIEPLGQTTAQVLGSSIDRLRSAPAAVATRDAQVVRWTYIAERKEDVVFAPEWQEWVWDDEGTGHLEAYADAPYSVTTDGEIVDPAGKAPEEGESIPTREDDIARYMPFASKPPSDVDGFRDYLQSATHLADDSDGLAIWGALSLLRDQWELTDAQQAAALELLAETGDLTLLGSTEDRFGRAGIAFRIDSPQRPSFGATIVLDANSRQIIAADILYLGGVDRLAVPAGSVVEYSVWLRR